MAGGAGHEGAPVRVAVIPFLESTFSGRPVRNRATGALTSAHTRVQRGTDRPRVEFSGGRAAGGSRATIGVDHWMSPHPGFTCDGAIGAVSGRLHADGTRFLFSAADGSSRATDGHFVSSWKSESDGYGHLVWTGKNNIRAVSDVIRDVDAIVHTAPGGLRDNIVLGHWATQFDTPGSATASSLKAVNDHQRRIYGGRFLDVQALLTSDWGLSSPPVADLRLLQRSDVSRDIRQGMVPMALLGGDRMHLNGWGNTIVVWALLERMKLEGWL